jgi:hypothetical protein
LGVATSVVFLFMAVGVFLTFTFSGAFFIVGIFAYNHGFFKKSLACFSQDYSKISIVSLNVPPFGVLARVDVV